MQNSKTNLLPQVSNRSRKSLEEIAGVDAYSSGENTRQLKAGLHQSPSVISLHDKSKHNQSREQI